MEERRQRVVSLLGSVSLCSVLRAALWQLQVVPGRRWVG